MKTSYLKKSTEPGFGKCNFILTACTTLFFFNVLAPVSPASAQAVLFDFNSAPLYSPLPINQTVSGITAHFSATGPGYSIQDVNTATVVPQGFTGRFIFPSSIYLSDLLISFDQAMTDFSIKYSTQELACDTSARMRVTAYMNSILVGTNTMVARIPGTWPVDTLSCSFPQGFDSVVVHYDAVPPSPCQDYGVIFIADDMQVTPFNASAVFNPKNFIGGLIIPNPVTASTTISFSLVHSENIKVAVYDITGRFIKSLFDGPLNIGEHHIHWNVTDDMVEGGVYLLNLSGGNFSGSYKLVVVK